MNFQQFLLFSVLSLVEYLALFIFMLILFKFSIREFMKQILLLSSLLLYISHSTRFEYKIAFLSPVIQMLIVFLFLWLFFKVHYWYAFIMTIAGYGSYIALQFLVFNIFSLLSIMSLRDVETYTPIFYLLPLSTATISFGMSWVVYKSGLGFSIVPYTQRVKVNLGGTNSAILGSGIFAIVIFIAANYLYFNQFIHTFAFFSIMLVVTLGILFYLIKRTGE